MKKKKIILLALLQIVTLIGKSQQNFTLQDKLFTEMPDSVKKGIIHSLDKLFSDINQNKISPDLLDKEDIEFNTNYFKYNFDSLLKSDSTTQTLPQIINFYKLTGSDKFIIQLVKYKSDNFAIDYIHTLVTKSDNGKYVFSSPLSIRTQSWKTKKIGDLTFHYPTTLNEEQAINFNEKNKVIASKLGVQVRPFQVYICNTYQEALHLIGIDYESSSNGYTNSGYIIDPLTLFTVKGNTDFSHDVVHIYAGEVRGKRNRTAEEGLAYLWGDAYHANADGYVPDLKVLIKGLQIYLNKHPEEMLLNIFTGDSRIYDKDKYGRAASSKSVISGVICNEIERVKGTKAIIELLNCGPGDDNYFNSIGKLIGINHTNFNEKVLPLIMKE